MKTMRQKRGNKGKGQEGAKKKQKLDPNVSAVIRSVALLTAAIDGSFNGNKGGGQEGRRVSIEEEPEEGEAGRNRNHPALTCQKKTKKAPP